VARRPAATPLSIITSLLHFGMMVVGLPYTAAAQMRIDEVSGGSPYGATTIAGGRGERHPSEKEIELARSQGRHVAEVASELAS
jgi:NAD(P)H dehydrogenase (quinone)